MKKRSLIMSLVLLSSSAFAAKLDLDLAGVIGLAEQRNEQVQITKHHLEQAKKTLDKAYTGLFPTIQLEAKAMKTTQNPSLFGSGFAILEENYQQIGSISLTQPIYTFGRLSGAIDAAKEQGKLAKNSSVATMANIEKTARTLFYNALYFKRALEISQESYDNALKNQKALKKRVSYGRISQDENLKMKADIASRKPALIEAKRAYDSSILDLKNFLNIEDSTSLSINGDLRKQSKKPSDKSKVELEKLVHVNLLKNQFELQKSLEGITAANYYPTLSFFGSYGKSAYFEDIREDHYLDQENVAFGLSLNMDFDLGGGKTYDRQISQIKTRVKQLELEQGKRQIRIAIDNLHEQYIRLEEKRVALQEAVSLAQNSYKIAVNSFSNGSISQTQLNDRELLLTNNKVAYARNLLQIELVKSEINNMETTN